MYPRRSPLSSRSHRFSITLRKFFGHGWRRRVLCLLLICGLLIVPNASYAISAATEVVVQIAKDTVAPMPVAVKCFKGLFRRSAKPRQETLADKLIQVA